MATDLFANFAVSSLLAGIAAGDVVLTVQVADASKFPAPIAGQQARLVLVQANTGLKEIVYCTARSTNSLTITRGQEGTAALAFAVGDIVAHRLTAGALNALFLNSAVAPPAPTWTAPALLNAWVNFGAPYETAAYSVDYLGFVHLRGTVKSGGIGAAIFNLPAGFRPLNNRAFAANSNGAHGMLLIQPNGDVVANTGSNVSFGLDGASFLAQQ